MATTVEDEGLVLQAKTRQIELMFELENWNRVLELAPYVLKQFEHRHDLQNTYFHMVYCNVIYTLRNTMYISYKCMPQGQNDASCRTHINFLDA